MRVFLITMLVLIGVHTGRSDTLGDYYRSLPTDERTAFVGGMAKKSFPDLSVEVMEKITTVTRECTDKWAPSSNHGFDNYFSACLFLARSKSQ